MPHSVEPESLWQTIAAVRDRKPMVHNITNEVVIAQTAQIITASGGRQITLRYPEEADEIAAVCQSLVINAGTPSTAWQRAADIAISRAEADGRPWILDPVAYGITPFRTRIMDRLLARRPTVLKCNAGEVLSLGGDASGMRGANSLVDSAGNLPEVRQAARIHGCTVVATGARDLISDGDRDLGLENGHPVMARLTGTGCMLTSVIGACLGVEADGFTAAAAGVAYFTIAGEIAAERAQGPGTLAAHLNDAMDGLERDMFLTRLRLADVS